jgi:hypothetical protein
MGEELRLVQAGDRAGVESGLLGPSWLNRHKSLPFSLVIML